MSEPVFHNTEAAILFRAAIRAEASRRNSVEGAENEKHTKGQVTLEEYEGWIKAICDRVPYPALKETGKTREPLRPGTPDGPQGAGSGEPKNSAIAASELSAIELVQYKIRCLEMASRVIPNGMLGMPTRAQVISDAQAYFAFLTAP